MREIRFRGKRIDNGKWVYGGLIVEHVEDKIFTYIALEYAKVVLFLINEDKGEIEPIYQIDPETIGQYTGLKDKNGREIYEGDIVRFQTWKGYNDVGEVVWAENNGFYIKGTRDEDIFWHPDNVKDLEIVSNIHDNPDF